MKVGDDKTFTPGPNRVFVFGSNRAGIHGGGAAAQALREFGAESGLGEGLRGSSYALPTKDESIVTLPLHEIRRGVDVFIALATARPDLEFFVTRVGCGLAGLTDAQIGPMFCGTPKNVELPFGWGGKLLDRREDGVTWKCVRANGTDFRTGTFMHGVGDLVVEPNVDTSSMLCSSGLHSSWTLRLAIHCSNGLQGSSGTSRPWRLLRLRVDPQHVMASGDDKMRASQYVVEKEYSRAEVFDHVLGEEFLKRLEVGRTEIADWKNIKWFKPTKTVTEADVAPILAQWFDVIAPYHAQRGLNRDIPRKARIITDRNVAIQAAKDWRPDAAADADAAAAADAAADDADADAAADAAAADAADADAAAAAAADAADAAAADAAAAAAAADAAAADAAAALWPYWASWNLRPRWAMFRAWRWRVFGLTTPNPWDPVVELYKLGVAPIGYRSIDGEVVFVIYAPAVTS